MGKDSELLTFKQSESVVVDSGPDEFVGECGVGFIAAKGDSFGFGVATVGGDAFGDPAFLGGGDFVPVRLFVDDGEVCAVFDGADNGVG